MIDGPAGWFGPTVKTVVLASAERVANELLQFDPGSKAQLRKLQGKTLAIGLSEPDLQLAVTSDGQAIKLMGYVESPSAEVYGRVSDIVAWLASGDSLAKHNLTVRGSTQLLQDWQNLAAQLDLDWEDIANRFLGDVAGHNAANALRGMLNWGQERGRNSADQIMEFGVEELKMLPNRALFEDFRTRNQALRLDIDRLEARLNRLKTRLFETSA